MTKTNLVSKVNSVIAPVIKKEVINMTGFITIGEMVLYKAGMKVEAQAEMVARKERLAIELADKKQEAQKLLAAARKASGIYNVANDTAKEIAFGAAKRDKGESRCSAYIKKMQKKPLLSWRPKT